MGDIQKRLDNVRQMIQSQDFLEGKGLSNEVNIRIFCYEPRDEMAVRHFIEQLSTDMTLGCQLRICNLYQIFLGICEGMDILDAIPDMEEEDGHDYLDSIKAGHLNPVWLYPELENVIRTNGDQAVLPAFNRFE